jgi:hypothetical protein
MAAPDVRHTGELANARASASVSRPNHDSNREGAPYAYDLDDCSAAQIDSTAKAIASAFGLPDWEGVVTAYRGRYRVELLYRTMVGGDHYSHVHAGIRRYPGRP